MNLQDLKKITTYAAKKGSVNPWSKERYVGVEIECIFPSSYLNKVFLAAEFIKLGLDKKVRIGDDNSITTPKHGHSTLEIRVIDLESQIKSTVTKVCQILKELKCYVNKSCGLHVHLDMRNRNLKERERIFNNLFKSQNFLYSLIDKKRRYSKYCNKLTKTFFKYIPPVRRYDPITGDATIIEESKYEKLPMNLEHASINDEGPRNGINVWAYKKHKTFEIRMHQGSLNDKQINRWIDILLTIVKRKDELKKEVPLKSKGLKVLGL